MAAVCCTCCCVQVGVLGDVMTNAENVVAKGRLGPGQMICADLETGGDCVTCNL
jgi:hypothetical protein